MSNDFKEINKYILSKCCNYPVLRGQILENGLLILKKPKLDLFTFLFKIIISQQISDKIADDIWSKICSKIGLTNPQIQIFSTKGYLDKILNEISISNQKKKYIRGIYKVIKENQLNITSLKKMNYEQFCNSLSRLYGVGPWTCDMTQIFFFNKKNIFPKNDLVINKVTKKLDQIEKRKINIKKRFSPFLSIFTLHLWKMSKRIL